MALSRKTKPRLWQPTFLVNRALVNDLRSEIGARFSTEKTPRILDVGCGGLPYKQLFAKNCREYLGCDLFPQTEEVVRCPADALAFKNETFDAVLSFQVLEHVRRPWKVVEECARVLKKDGLLLLTAPFMFPHHSSPHDFFRYTHEGLAALADDAGLKVEKILAQCSSLSTLMLMLNWYLTRPLNWLRRSRVTAPLCWFFSFAVTAPINLLGLLFDSRFLKINFTKGNEGYCNFLILCRKT